MKIDTQILDDHQAKLTVEVGSDRMDAMKQRAAAKIAKKVRVPGFRPGKAPYHVIVRQMGESAIIEEAIEMLVEEIYPDVIKEADIKPYGPGQLSNISSMDPVKLEFVVPLEAEVELGDYQSIRRPYEPETVSDEDVERVVEDLRERQAILEPVERPVQAGDLVTVKLGAERRPAEKPAEEPVEDTEQTVDEASTEGEPETSVEGEKETAAETPDRTLIRERSMPLVVYEADAKEGQEEWPYPGFTSQLIGMNVGDEKTLEYTWPEDSTMENLRGTTAEFNFTVENVKARTLPELNDEFVTSLEGGFNNVEELRKNIREMLENQSNQAYNQGYDDAILEQAIEGSTFRYPPQMLEREIDSVIHDLEHRLEDQKMDMNLYLKSRGMDQNGLREEVKPVAESRIKRAMFLAEFGKVYNIQIPPEELQQEAISTLNYLYSTLPEKDAKKLSNREVYSNIVGNVLADMMSRRAMETFRNLASGQLEQNALAQAAAAETPIVEQESTTPAGEELGAAQPEEQAAEQPSEDQPLEQPAESPAGEAE